MKSFRPSKVNLEQLTFSPTTKSDHMHLIEAKYENNTFILRLDNVIQTGLKTTQIYGTQDINPKRYRLGVTINKDDEQFFKDLQEHTLQYIQENRKLLGLKKASDDQIEEMFQPFAAYFGDAQKQGKSPIVFTTVFKDNKDLAVASGCHCALRVQGIVLTLTNGSVTGIKWSTSLQQIKLKERVSVDLLD